MANPYNDLLPDSAKELLNFIGEDAIYALLEEYGGTRLCVPAKDRKSSELIRLLGEKAAKALCFNYGGSTISLPVCMKARNARRSVQMLHDKRQGATLKALAKQYGVTEVTISNSLRKAEQLELANRSKGKA